MKDHERIATLRKIHGAAELHESDAGDDPIALFGRWMDLAVESGLTEPNAMSVATATKEGRPSCRVLLLKEFDGSGFVFYSNYGSRKGGELLENPYAALLFYWYELEKQVRIEGRVERVSRAESEAYFRIRPRESQVGAHASRQSRAIPDREFLEKRFDELSMEFQDREVPCPEEWGGYRLIPDQIEFWQGRPNRLHDRLRYTRDQGAWKRERLNP